MGQQLQAQVGAPHASFHATYLSACSLSHQCWVMGGPQLERSADVCSSSQQLYAAPCSGCSCSRVFGSPAEVAWGLHGGGRVSTVCDRPPPKKIFELQHACTEHRPKSPGSCPVQKPFCQKKHFQDFALQLRDLDSLTKPHSVGGEESVAGRAGC